MEPAVSENLLTSAPMAGVGSSEHDMDAERVGRHAGFG